MKTIFTLILCSFSIVLHTQTIEKLDTIYANETKVVFLIFPKPIRQGIVGNSHFVFSYNKNIAQYFGILQATPGSESNLLIITNDGKVYSYILKYVEKIKKLNYFISEKQSIGNERPSTKTLNPEKRVLAKTTTIDINKSTIYKKTCVELMLKSKKKHKRTKNVNQIRLSLKNSMYKNNLLYFLMEITNKSAMDYDVNFLHFFISNRRGIKKKSYQTIFKEPLFTYLLPNKINGKTKCEFIIVFSKFNISKHKKMIIELHELHGERTIKLKIPSKLITNSK